VQKTTSGTAAQMDELEGQLRDLTKILPASHEEIAAVAEAAGQLGVARQDLAKFTETAINLGQATNLSADDAATSIAQFLNVMGAGADEVDHVGNTWSRWATRAPRPRPRSWTWPCGSRARAS
jgi:TP901 family phage tail tape measure protein